MQGTRISYLRDETRPTRDLRAKKLNGKMWTESTGGVHKFDSVMLLGIQIKWPVVVYSYPLLPLHCAPSRGWWWWWWWWWWTWQSRGKKLQYKGTIQFPVASDLLVVSSRWSSYHSRSSLLCDSGWKQEGVKMNEWKKWKTVEGCENFVRFSSVYE